jgi:lipoprotein-anchoring transpeptidase ErfK/SrfK
MWVLALMALSAAARGQENREAQPSTALGKQGTSGTSEQVKDPRDRAPHPLSPKPEVPSNPAEAKQSESSDQVMLARFIIISIPDRQLALVDDGRVVKTYPIAVGADDTPSPHGDFKIISRVSNPSWAHKGKVVAPGKKNPVGSRWMGLSLKGYGIHGTNAPRSIGKAASHGCFRMSKKDVEELFGLVRVGDTVTIRGERDELAAQVFTAGIGEVQVASTATDSVDVGED